MRLDHISYVTSHEQLADTVQRLGSIIGSAFMDGGIHPGFGTRNFTLPLNNGNYLEVVCPLDHPAVNPTPFGRMVSKLANEGGGWATWVVATNDISLIEKQIGRKAVIGHRKRPDGVDLQWKQIGVLDTLQNFQFPFFIEWLTGEHPSSELKTNIEILKLEIYGNEIELNDWLGVEVSTLLKNIKIEWKDPAENDGNTGLLAVHLKTLNGTIRIE